MHPHPNWTGQTGFLVTVIMFGIVLAGAPSSEANMEGEMAASEKSVHESRSVCAGEQEYVQERKKHILESLKNLEINCSEDSVPHIALLASGGGQRAAVGLVGSLHQMEKDHLLDSVLYLGGVSGSTWAMAFLYSDPEWSVDMDRTVNRLLDAEVELQDALAWLGERAKEEHFSLTDIWGVLTSAGIMKQMDLRNLSDEANRNTTNPYPVYCAIEKYCYAEGPIEGKWFEVSPHEAGFTELGLFVETSLLGSKFQNGELMEKIPEMDMVKLQVPGHVNSAGEEYLRFYMALDKLIALTRSTIKNPSALSELDKLQKVLADADKSNQAEYPDQESLSFDDKKSTFQRWSLNLLALVETWSQSLEEGAFKTHVTFITEQVLPLIVKWEWGTTNNFLYRYENSSIPLCLTSKESFHLVDAGLLINVAYPSFLGDKRDIDLIIAPEYSAGNLFETLTLARDYAAELKKPFPEIDEKILEEKDWPKDCYVFEGKEKEPTIVYLPLFNRNNCKDAEEVKARMSQFSTFQRPFSREESRFLLETAEANVRNNKETLLKEINKAAVRRRNKQRTPGLQKISETCLFGLV
ncbi:cytosolic phospholipase A2 gamma-like isoform X2 [Halichoeres trimaculatus]|uniref:cytosolic phospholipase A2 gamma-like isoform X2 n=1 Tax=Halichoeres trimaculatus TaxID=147232 RepID=UPI003D9F8AD2